MPADFRPEEHGLQRLAVTCRNGVAFASFGTPNETLESYLGDRMLGYFDRVFNGRDLVVLGYMRQRIPSNWKLMFENIKDPYHASLMHVFLVTFGLFRADQSSAVRMDATGRHACLISRKGEQRATPDTADIQNLREDFTLHDARLLAPVREFPGDATVVRFCGCVPRNTGTAARSALSAASASGKDRGTFLQEGSAALVIIGAIETRFNRALDHSEIAFGLRFEEFSTGEFGRPDGERRVGADHGCVVLHIRRQFRVWQQAIDQAHAHGLVPVEAPAGKQDLACVGRSD